MGALAGRDVGRLSVIVLSVAAYALAVSSAPQRAVAMADAHGCVDLHAVQYSALLLAGAAAGLAAGPALVRWSHSGLAALLPRSSAGRRLTVAHGGCVLVLAACCAANFLWVGPGLDAFIDAHRVVGVEVAVLLYAMGALAGGAAQLLLDRHGWVALLLVPAMALLLVGGGVTGSGWC